MPPEMSSTQEVQAATDNMHDVVHVSVSSIMVSDEKITTKDTPSDNDHSAVAERNETPTDDAPTLRYRLVCSHDNGPDFICEQDGEPFNVQAVATSLGDEEGSSGPIFDVVTDVVVHTPMLSSANELSELELLHQEIRKSESGVVSVDVLSKKNISKVVSTRIIIRSPRLLQAIREVVQYQPTQNLTGDTITIREPYWVLMHHYDKLETFKAKIGATPEDAKTIQEFDTLFEFLKPISSRLHGSVKRRLSQSCPTIVFDDVWYLLRPGSFAYCRWENEWIGCIIMSLKLKTDREDGEASPSEKWRVRIWFLDQDENGGFSRSFLKIRIKRFEGEQNVTSLPVLPREVFDKFDNGERHNKLVERGSKIADMVWNDYAYLEHDGKTMSDEGTYYKGPIIAESRCQTSLLPSSKWVFPAPAVPKDTEYVRPVGGIPQSLPSPFAGFLAVDKGRCKREDMTRDHLFLISPVIVGFALGTKTWYQFHIDRTTPVKKAAEEAPHANIGQENINLIEALANHQMNTRVHWSADFVKEKGDGIVVLLHGPPGVGKTYTVETTAMRLQRPLISLTIADIGIGEDKIESELSSWFSLAQRWKAVLLIDEADIFLERRKYTDIKRNGIVSAFLRKMEYFGGLLFLTTNRVGQIDDAFRSRAHVVIGFELLTPDARSEIWKSFFDKLKRERKGQIRVPNGAQKFVLEGKEVRSMAWNGREIRNALQTAIALAEFESTGEDEEILVEESHFRRVMEMSDRFKGYLKSIAGKDEADRAAELRDRNDHANRDQGEDIK